MASLHVPSSFSFGVVMGCGGCECDILSEERFGEETDNSTTTRMAGVSDSIDFFVADVCGPVPTVGTQTIKRIRLFISL